MTCKTALPYRTIILLVTLAAVAIAMTTFAAFTVNAQEPPGTITGISVDTARPGQAAIAWNEVSIARDYRVMWAPIDQAYKTYTDPSGNFYPTTNSQTLTGLTEGADYKFKIRARFTEPQDGKKAGPWSSEVTFTVSATPPPTPEPTPEPTPGPTPEVPAKPTGLAAKLTPSDQVKLSWKDPGDDTITHYQVFRRHDFETPFASIVDDTGSTTTSYTDDTVDADVTYQYRVAAVNAQGASDKSRRTQISTPKEDTDPTPDNAVRSAGDATGTVTITGRNIIGHEVTASVSDLADPDGVPTDVTYSYQWVSVSIPDSEETEIPGATGNTYRISETFTATVTDPNTDMDTERTFENFFTRLKVRVGFTDSAGNAETLTSDAWPTIAHITYGVPTAPQELTVEVRGPDQLDPVWAAPAGDGGRDITGYIVQHSPGDTNDWQDLATTTGTRYAHTPLVPQSTWYYRVAAVNSLGTSAFSEPVMATTTTIPSFGFTQTTETQLEEGGRITVCVELFPTGGAIIDNHAPFSVTITSKDDTAKAGSDYIPTQEVVSFAKKDKAVDCIQIDLINDKFLEGSPEAFTVRLSTEDTGKIRLDPAILTVEIYEEDQATLHITPTSQSVYEGSDAAYTITMMSGGDLVHADASIRVGVGADTPMLEAEDTTPVATAGDDYTGAEQDVTIKAGESIATFSIPVRVDMVAQVVDEEDPNQVITESDNEIFNSYILKPAGDRRFNVHPPAEGQEGRANSEVTIIDVPQLTGLSTTHGKYGLELTTSWDNPGNANIDVYEYRYSTNGGSSWNPNWTTVPRSGPETTSVRLTEVPPVEHTIQVRALDGDATVYIGEIKETPNPTPDLTGMTTQHGPDGNELSISWDNVNDPFVQYYQYRYSVDAGSEWTDWTTIRGSGSSTTSFTLSDIETVEHKVQVRARSGTTITDMGEVTETPLPPPPAPGLPREIQTVYELSAPATLTWLTPSEVEDPRAPLTGFAVQMRKNESSSWSNKSHQLNAGKEQNLAVSGFRAGDLVEARIASVNRVGQSEWVETTTFRMQVAQERPRDAATIVPVSMGPLVYGYWTDADGSNHRSEDRHRYDDTWLLNDCMGDQHFTLGWTTMDSAVRRYEAYTITQHGAHNVRHRFGSMIDGTGLMGLFGTVNVHGYSLTQVWVRALVDLGGTDTWTRWLGPIDFQCFTDDDPLPGSPADSPRNYPVEGRPVITGIPQVENYNDLTLDTSAIFDPNGFTENHRFAVEWVFRSGDTAKHIKDDPNEDPLYVIELSPEHMNQTATAYVTYTDADEFEELVVSNPVFIREPAPLWGKFSEDLTPAFHDGSTQFTTVVSFISKLNKHVADVTDGRMASGVFNITGGTIDSAQEIEIDGSALVHWQLAVTPSGNGDVTITLPVTADCRVDNAVCTIHNWRLGRDPRWASERWGKTDSDSHGRWRGVRPLDAGDTITIPGPEDVPEGPPLTAGINLLGNTTHDGDTAFTIRVTFSENISSSYTAVRDHLLTITNGEVTSVSRDRPDTPQVRDRVWNIVIRPSEDSDLTIQMNPTTGSCQAQEAICTANGRKLQSDLRRIIRHTS